MNLRIDFCILSCWRKPAGSPAAEQKLPRRWTPSRRRGKGEAMPQWGRRSEHLDSTKRNPASWSPTSFLQLQKHRKTSKRKMVRYHLLTRKIWHHRSRSLLVMVSSSWPLEQIDVSLPTLVTLGRRPPSSPPPSVLVSDCEAGSPGLWWHSRKTCLWSWMASAGEHVKDTVRLESHFTGVTMITKQLPLPNLWISDGILLAEGVSCWGIDLLGFYWGKPKSKDEVEIKDKGTFNSSFLFSKLRKKG